MENLEIQERVICLGKKLLSSLKDSDPDKITAWMVNYIAEQIVDAESGNEEDKRNCFNTILKLWENRTTLPDGSRPFESFERIFRALESLSPESMTPRYINNSYDDESNENLDESIQWIDLAKKLDSATRILITFMFEQAIDSATDKNTKEWLEVISGTFESNEYEVIIRHLHEHEMSEQEQRIKKLENRINQLKCFEDLCIPIRQGLEEELSLLKK